MDLPRMILPRTVLRIPVEAPRDQVLRRLGIRSRDRAPRESLLRILDEELDAAHALADPQVLLATTLGLPGSTAIDPAMPLALAVCTLGAALDRRVDDHTDGGHSARAMVLDAIGSALVEELADRSNGRICELAIQAGLAPDVRSSPGYGRWPVQEQRLIFEQLEPADIGVTLTRTCLMNPSKSISYAVPLRGGSPGTRARGRCSRCGFVDCSYRHTEAPR